MLAVVPPHTNETIFFDDSTNAPFSSSETPIPSSATIATEDATGAAVTPESLLEKHSLRKKLKLDDSSKDPPLLMDRKPWVVGHRGALYHDLENTLQGFQYCADIGIDAIELDVFLVAGELVVFHGGGTDENPGDLTDYCLDQIGKKILDCTSLQEIQSLKFNPACLEFGVEDKAKVANGRIPTLRQVLEMIKKDGRMICKIELKGPGVTIPTLDLVQQMGVQHLCHFSSFNHARLALVRQLHPEKDPNGEFVYRTGALFHGNHVPSTFIQDALQVGASEVHLQYDDCSTDRIAAIHEAGMGSMAYFRGPVGMKEDVTLRYWDVGMEDEAMYKTVLETGVQQLCCNQPQILHNLLKHHV